MADDRFNDSLERLVLVLSRKYDGQTAQDN